MVPQARTGGGMQTQPLGQQRGRPTRPGVRPGLQPVTVDDIVETDVVTAQRDTPVATVAAKMSEQDVGSVVVVENDQPVGVLTDRRIALALENTPDLAQKQAGDLLSGDLVTGTTKLTVFDALRQLKDEGIRRLPIVDDDGTLEGIVTLDDIFVLLGSELNKASETIRTQSPRY